MSEASGDTGGEVHRVTQIPSVLTSSARAILSAFGENITSIEANGSVETINTTAVDGLETYGLSREQETLHRLTLSYDRLRRDDEPANPLTEDVCEQIFSELEAVLDTESLRVEPDLTVTSFCVEIEDQRLQEVTRAQTPEFELQFEADPAEPPLREPTKQLNIDRGLYSELGFNITNLNLRRVTETAAKLHKQSDERLLSWGGHEDIRPRAPEKLAIRINDHILPEPYGTLKPFTVIDDSVLEVAEDELEDLGTHMVSSGNVASGGEN
jgi:hypothetical protein